MWPLFCNVHVQVRFHLVPCQSLNHYPVFLSCVCCRSDVFSTDAAVDRRSAASSDTSQQVAPHTGLRRRIARHLRPVQCALMSLRAQRLRLRAPARVSLALLTLVEGVNPSQSYGASPAIWDHTVLPATRPTQVSAPHLNPSHAGRYSIYLPRRDGRLSLPCYSETQPPGVELATSRSRIQRTTEPSERAPP